MAITIRGIKLPTINNIKGRSSSIRASFIKAILPEIISDEIKERDAIINESLHILYQTKEGELCSYCGTNKATEWDHFQPIVRNKLPTGYITDLYNLIPSCSKCNQSKGSRHWKEWLDGKAKESPASRKVDLLDEIRNNLEKFELEINKNTVLLSPEELVKTKEYLTRAEDFLKSLEKFQEEADKIKESIYKRIKK
jgi:hypothetical protein